MRDFRLYVILDTQTLSEHGDIIEIARQVILGGADILQLRAKNLTDRQILKVAQTIKEISANTKASFVLNDRADLAQIIGTDGLHLGQDDLPVKEARKILGQKKIIGLSTHSLEQIKEAEKQKVDYIAIGPIFPTLTKPKSPPISLKIIFEIKVKVPFVAVGGITLDNLGQILASGAQRVAVSRAIIGAKDVFNVTKEFRRRLYG